MAKIVDVETFNVGLENKLVENDRLLNEQVSERTRILIGVKEKADVKDVIVISFDEQLLVEYSKFKNFKNSTNRYYEHPADPHIPVKRHFHVVGPRDNREIYAVNIDGSAHHKRNRGLKLSKREADELRGLGVEINSQNMLESIELKDVDFTGFVIIVSEKAILND